LVSDFESLLLASGARAAGKGADPSPITTTVLTELKEAASLTALRAPANIRAARAAIMVFFMGYNLLQSNLVFAEFFIPARTDRLL